MPARSNDVHKFKLILGLFLMAGVVAAPSFGQTNQPTPTATQVPKETRNDYPIGVGDVLSIGIVDAPEISGKYRVADTGYIVIAGLPEPIKAQGLTAVELARSIGDALKAAELLREPRVGVFVEGYHSRTIAVLGAVNRPSVYALEKPTTLLEALSLAGGLAPTAGPTAIIVHTGAPPGTEGSSGAELAQSSAEWTQTVKLSMLMEGRDPSHNFELSPGDVVNVSTAPVVYVMGAVIRPGGFVLPDSKSGITVLKALAMAEGLKPISGAKRSVIVRRSASGSERQEMPVDVAKLMAGKIADQALEPNDILFIPESYSKKTIHMLANTALQGVNYLAMYSGIRVATR